MIHRIAITPGEPAGIGPDICVLISQQPPKDIELVFIADSEILEERAEKQGIDLGEFIESALAKLDDGILRDLASG